MNILEYNYFLIFLTITTAAPATAATEDTIIAIFFLLISFHLFFL